MPNLYARATALPNIVGRVDYISNPSRQERFLGAHDGAADLLDGQFWRVLANESQAAFEQFSEKDRDGKSLKCCQGREMVIQLSNELLQRFTPEEICRIIANEFREKEGLICAVGLHLKHSATKDDNLHAHVIFAERQLLDEPVVKVAKRNLFFDANGTRRYKKSDILDSNKQLLPGCRIVKKDEIYELRYFGSVDAKFRSKAWLKHLKTDVILPLRNGKLKGDVEITEYDKSTGKLAQQHIGNNVLFMDNGDQIVAGIEEFNAMVKAYNRMVDAGQVSHEDAMFVQEAMAAARAEEKNEELREMIRQLHQIHAETLAHMKAQAQTRQQSHSLDDLIGQAIPDNMEIRRPLRARRDWRVQRMVDTVRVTREMGAKNIADLERGQKERGQELGRAKQALASAKERFERGEIDKSQLEAAQARCDEAREQYKKAARAIDAAKLEQIRQINRAEPPARGPTGHEGR